MKNFNLLWARERAGLTQALAAKKMGVDRRTFGRWETGAVAMPNRKWQVFLKLCELKVSELPERLQYDAKGYPVGFDPEIYDTDGDYDVERVEAALADIEGDQHRYRARERQRLFWSTGNCPLSGTELAKEMARYDAEQRRWDAELKSREKGRDLV